MWGRWEVGAASILYRQRISCIELELIGSQTGFSPLPNPKPFGMQPRRSPTSQRLVVDLTPLPARLNRNGAQPKGVKNTLSFRPLFQALECVTASVIHSDGLAPMSGESPLGPVPENQPGSVAHPGGLVVQVDPAVRINSCTTAHRMLLIS